MVNLEMVRTYYEREDRRVVRNVLEACGPNTDRILSWLYDQAADEDRATLMNTKLDLARRLVNLSQIDDDPGMLALAVDLADVTVRSYVDPPGSIVEYDWMPWLPRGGEWPTIPWGVAFRGKDMMDSYDILADALDAEQRMWWDDALLRMGLWIHGNPVVGSYVFNCAVDLCHLLWRLGTRFSRQEWVDWALVAAKTRIERDVDSEGWIQGEGGGASGVYQALGAAFLATFAWDSGDPVLGDAADRTFELGAAFATSHLDWPGNFGTRSSRLQKLRPEMVLVAAARGDPVAGGMVSRFGQPSWSRDLELWEAALKAPRESARRASHLEFRGIQAHVLREGPSHVVLANYDRSLWARGFINLWHEEHGDFVFSTLHSLPSRVEKAELRLGDTSDWSGFPHVRAMGAEVSFDSHQRIDGISVDEGEGITATWSEPLLDREGTQAGRMACRLGLLGEVLEISVELTELAGPATLDFHLMKGAKGFYQVWDSDALDEIAAGSLPSRHGVGELEPPSARFGVQIDGTVFAFELLESENCVGLSVGHLQVQGLHSSNHGGVRVRFESDDHAREVALRIRFQRLGF